MSIKNLIVFGPFKKYSCVEEMFILFCLLILNFKTILK